MAQVQFREPKTAAEVFANAKATHDYFKRLRSPPPKLVIVAPPVVTLPPEPIEAPAEHKVPAVPEINQRAVSMAGEGRTFEAIRYAVCIHYGVTKTDVMSRRRTHNLVRPRQVISYLVRRLTLHSLPEIGRRMGGKDHTTIMHGAHKMERLREHDQVFSALLDAFEAQLRPIIAEVA